MNPRFVPRIDQPCPLKWESMQGDDKKRFCSVCQLHVHDLSAMSAEERTKLLSGTDRKCVTYLDTPELVKIDIRRWQFLDRVFTFLRPALAGLIGCLPLFAANANPSQGTETSASPTATPKPKPSPSQGCTTNGNSNSSVMGRVMGQLPITPTSTPKASPTPTPTPTPKATPETPGRTLGIICPPPSATPKPSTNSKTGH